MINRALRTTVRVQAASTVALVATVGFGPAAMATGEVADHYTIIDLGDLPGRTDGTVPWAINGAAIVVGGASVQGSEFFPRAFAWKTGRIFDLGTLGGEDSIAYDISESNVIVGQSTTIEPRSAWRAFAFDQGRMQMLPELISGQPSAATAVNDLGDVVGYSRTGSGRNHAVRWQDDQVVDLGMLPGGIESMATNINNDGDIIGIVDRTQLFPKGFIIRGNGMEELVGLKSANAINDVGVVVGRGALDAGRWEDGITTRLQSLTIYGSEALDINDDGLMVGWSFALVGSALVPTAAVWDAGGDVYDARFLIDREPEYRLLEATSVNNHGQILVAAELDEEPKALLLSPASLELAKPTPGLAGEVNRLPFGGRPNTLVVLGFSFSRGAATLPGCGSVMLSLDAPRIADRATTDQFGGVDFSIFVPERAKGLQVFFQAADVGGCAISNVVDATFE